MFSIFKSNKRAKEVAIVRHSILELLRPIHDSLSVGESDISWRITVLVEIVSDYPNVPDCNKYKDYMRVMKGLTLLNDIVVGEAMAVVRRDVQKLYKGFI